MGKVVISYPIWWYNYKTRKRHSMGYLRVYKNEHRYRMHISDATFGVDVPLGIMCKIVKIMKEYCSLDVGSDQNKKLIVNFKDGIDIKKFMKFKWHKTARSNTYSNEYLKWKAANNLPMNESEKKVYELRKKTGIGKFYEI